MSLPQLPDDVDPFHQFPDADLLDKPCDSCAGPGIPIADVQWTDAEGNEPCGRVVCRDCLVMTVDYTRTRRADGTNPVAVDVPAWTIHDLAKLVDCHPVVIAEWVTQGWLTPEPQVVATSPTRVLADQAHHARSIARLHGKGLRPDAAHRLLRGSLEDQAVAEAILNAPALGAEVVA